jgi:hypothetical protein
MSEILRKAIWHVVRTEFFSGLHPKICHSRSFFIKGKTQTSKFDFSMLFFAGEGFTHYISQNAYDKEPDIEPLGKVSIDEINPLTKNLKPDIVFVNSNVVFLDYFLSNNFFVLPYINSSLDISDSWNKIYERMHRSKQRLVRRIQGLNYSYVTTKEKAELQSLYYEMYLPQILKKHGKSAEIVSFSECKRFFNKGWILSAKSAGKTISSAICVPNGNELYIPILNTNQEDNNLARYANGVAFYFSVLFAKEKGYTSIDYGSSLPFLKDGVFQYKREWGMRMKPFQGDEERILAVKVCNFNEGTRDFLLSNPFIFLDSGNLRGLVMFDGELNLTETYYAPGLSGLTVICSEKDSHRLKEQCRSITVTGSSESSFLNPLLQLIRKEGFEAYNMKFNIG